LGFCDASSRQAKRWHLAADEIPHLPERNDVGRALSFEEKARLLRMVAAKAEWDTARLATLLAPNTTMRGYELKGLRWRQVDFTERLWCGAPQLKPMRASV
jgi:integrase